ncbi:biopolymer transporter ExbD [candidate division KSB1 bacterium]|nr:biopolymer transporter ExbD [candidate division KSB1 bacterium]
MLKKRQKTQVEIPQASLADIAFLILIFYLATTTINIDKGIGLTLPVKGEAKEVAKQNVVSLLINAQGEVLLDDEVVAISAIKAIIRNKLLANDKLIVSVKADKETEYRTYLAVLDQLKQAEVARISIAEPD